MLSMVAALQAPIIMMSQNRQAAKDHLEDRIDSETNAHAAREIARVQEKLDLLLEILIPLQAGPRESARAYRSIKDQLASWPLIAPIRAWSPSMSESRSPAST